jgi:dCTP deaminase
MLCCVEGRSRFARIGLFVHITAGFMNPGIDNRQVLEIYNASNVCALLLPACCSVLALLHVAY